MSLAPTATVTLGSLRYDSHVTDLHVTLALLPAVNSFVVDLPASVKFTAVPDDDATLAVSGGDDAGDGEQTLLTGEVRQVRRTLDHIRVIGADAIPPGGSGSVRLHLPAALPLLPGDRFVLRESGRAWRTLLVSMCGSPTGAG